MKKIMLGYTFLISFLVHADQQQETFLKAGVYYQQGRMQEALALYNEIKTAYPAVLYNKGLCFYTLGDYPQAALAFRTVQRSGTRALSKKASEAFDLTQKKLAIENDLPWFSVLATFNRLFSGDLIRILFLLFLALFSFLFVTGIMRWRTGCILALALISTGGGVLYTFWFSCQRYGLVLSKKAEVYAGPDTQFHRLAELSAGNEVKVVQHEQTWYKVYFPAGQGWVQEKDLGLF